MIKKMNTASTKQQRGLTLLEVLIAISIGSVILLTILAVMRQVTFLSEKTVDDSRFYRELNRKIEEMVRDIRSSQVDYVAYGCPVTNSPAWTSPYCGVQNIQNGKGELRLRLVGDDAGNTSKVYNEGALETAEVDVSNLSFLITPYNENPYLVAPPYSALVTIRLRAQSKPGVNVTVPTFEYQTSVLAENE